MGTSIGAATDWLVANFTTAVAAVNPYAVVGDSVPPMDAPAFVVVGRTLPDDPTDTTGTQTPMSIGLNKVEEEYSIPCYVAASAAGPAQKPSRDAAIVLFDACHGILALNKVNRTLGGALADGRYAYVDNLRVIAANAKDAKDAGALCSTWIGFDVHIRNHYQP